MNQTKKPYTFTLENFEGPLDFLLHLVQQDEVDITDIPIKQLTAQYLDQEGDYSFDKGAEFVGTAALLLWLKSKMLLPKHEQTFEEMDLEADPRFEIIHKLVEYCRVKDAAKELSLMESRQSGFYARGSESPGELKKFMGIDHLSLDDLAQLFQQVLAKAAPRRGSIHEEEWRVSDKIAYVRQRLRGAGKIAFGELFSSDMCRGELVVTFLAVLELMKMGEIKAIHDKPLNTVVFVP